MQFLSAWLNLTTSWRLLLLIWAEIESENTVTISTFYFLSDTVRALVKCQFTFTMTLLTTHIWALLSLPIKINGNQEQVHRKNLRSEGGEGVKFNCNRFAPLIGGIAILPVASCHRNHDKFYHSGPFGSYDISTFGVSSHGLDLIDWFISQENIYNNYMWMSIMFAL